MTETARTVDADRSASQAGPLVGLRSRRQIAPFALHRPGSIEEAAALHQAPGANAFLAGGIDLIDWLKYGHVLDRLIRLDGIPKLAMISADDDALRVGAMATHAAIIDSPVIHDLLPDFARLWHHVANPRVRFVGTIGGNVMAARSDYDGLPALLALGAKAMTVNGPASPDQARGLTTGFIVPQPSCQRLFTDRSLRPALSVWLGLTVTSGTVRTLRVAIGMAHPAPVCVTLQPDLPLAALGQHAASLSEQVLRQMPEPITDGRSSAAYRRRMVGVLVRRILIQAGDTA